MKLWNFKSLIGSSAVLLLASVLTFTMPATSWAGEAETNGVNNSGASVAPLVEIAQAQNSNEEETNDPLEPVNRVIFEFNEFLQDAFLRPITTLYNENVNATIRQGVSNFLDNLSSPVDFANEVLQGEFTRALRTLSRTLINTTLGIGGLADVAAEMGVEGNDEDFGQTLAVHGVGEGFYLVLPVFGPSNPRDAIGKFLVDGYFDPLGLYLSNTDQDNVAFTLAAVRGIDEYAGIVDELNQVKKTSVDYYAAIRSLYRQKRKTEIRNGSVLELPPIPDLSYDITPDNFDQSLAGFNQPTAK